MKKTICLLFAFIALLSGCGKKAEVPPLADLADELHGAGVFSTEISPVTEAVALQMYGLDSADVAEGVYYFSSGASSDEMAFVKAVSESAAKKIVDAFEARVLFQAETYADYMPEEVPKLEDAVVRRDGLFVLLCVAENADGVVQVMDKYF